MEQLEQSLLLLRTFPHSERMESLALLIKIYRNIVQSPQDLKFQKISLTNKNFSHHVWSHPCLRTLLFSTGWKRQEQNLILENTNFVRPVLEKILDERLRKPDATTEDMTCIIFKSPEKAREEQLRAKALAQKEKEIEECKKDMAERKRIAELIVKEHRMDTQLRKNRVYQSSPLVGSKPMQTPNPGPFQGLARPLNGAPVRTNFPIDEY